MKIEYSKDSTKYIKRIDSALKGRIREAIATTKGRHGERNVVE